MWRVFKKLIIANPMGMFLWGIIAKWYIMVSIASLVVLFYVAKGLEQIGLIKYMTNTTTEILYISKSIAQNCTTKLGPTFEHLTDFWQCLGNPPQYETREEETREKYLEDSFKKLLPSDKIESKPTSLRNPYEATDNLKDNNG
jgi:hypothetical protein